MGYEKEAYLYLLLHYTGKKIFKSAHQKSKCLCSGHCTDVTFLAVGYHPPIESQLAVHIYNVKYENTLTCKRISWDLGGGWMF